MTKLTPPPLVPSAEERATTILMLIGEGGGAEKYIQMQHEKSFRAGVDAVIAMLRSPDNRLLVETAIQLGCGTGHAKPLLLKFADLLEARRG
jgi:hypothetical protein